MLNNQSQSFTAQQYKLINTKYEIKQAKYILVFEKNFRKKR